MNATKRKAMQVAARHGFDLWEPSYSRATAYGDVTIDAIGSNQIGYECRGHVVSGRYLTAAEFWAEVISEIQDLDAPSGPCPDPDNCDLHSTTQWPDYGENGT